MEAATDRTASPDGGQGDPPTGAGDADVGEPAGQPTSPPHNTVVRITVSSECVRVGDVLVVTISGPPKAGVGAVIGFSDAQAHGATMVGQTDADGMFVWRVTIEPTVPPGEATVLATATGSNGQQQGGGRASEKLRVGDLTGC